MDGTAAKTVDLPYWQVNMPRQERTATCPDFLRNLSSKDVGIIGTPDAAYTVDSWPAVLQRVRTNRLDLFQRRPSDLRRYLEWKWRIAREHGSVLDFILQTRLPAGWAAREKKPFAHGGGDDVCVRWNDWPYGLDPRIVHLVVWTKFELEEDAATGDLSDRARGQIDDYVNRTFGARMDRSNYVWFRNWAWLKSVEAVEHFHVMLFDPDPTFVDELTGGVAPLCKTLAK